MTKKIDSTLKTASQKFTGLMGVQCASQSNKTWGKARDGTVGFATLVRARLKMNLACVAIAARYYTVTLESTTAYRPLVLTY